MKLKKLWSFLTRKPHHTGSTFKPGSRPAPILEMLCEGNSVSGWDVCKALRTHNGDRDLRHVRRCLRASGVVYRTFVGKAGNGRYYKITFIEPWWREAARQLIKGTV